MSEIDGGANLGRHLVPVLLRRGNRVRGLVAIVDEHLPAVIIRPGAIFGPGDRPNFGRMAVRLRARRAVIVGSGDNALPLVYVSDVVKALVLALEHDDAVGQAYNIGNGGDNRLAIDKARLELGYSPAVSLHDGSQRAAVWYRSQWRLPPTPEPVLTVASEAPVL